MLQHAKCNHGGENKAQESRNTSLGAAWWRTVPRK